jgi:hypothetical protein
MAASLADLHAEVLLRRPLLAVANPDAFAGAAPYAVLAGPTRAAVEACGATPADPTAVADADLAPLAGRWGKLVDLLLLYAFRDAVGAFSAVSTAVGGVARPGRPPTSTAAWSSPATTRSGTAGSPTASACRGSSPPAGTSASRRGGTGGAGRNCEGKGHVLNVFHAIRGRSHDLGT